MWHKLDRTKYNYRMSYDENMENGAGIPKEGWPVIVYDGDRKKYLIGIFQQEATGIRCVFEKYSIDPFISDRFMWQEFEFAPEEG